MADQEEPKIIIDSDWKQEAQAEKARLSEAEKTADEPKARSDMPKPTITSLIEMLVSNAIMSLGQQDPKTGQVYIALEAAQFYIELLTELDAKTKGNLSEDESQIMTRALSELRLIYADTAKHVEQAMQEGKIAAAPPPTAPSPKD